MGLDAGTGFATRHRRWVVLAALLVTFGAVALVLDRPKGAAEVWLAPPLFAAGAGLFAWGVWPRTQEPARAGRPTLAVRLLNALTRGGRLTRLFPAVGAGLVALDLAYNFLASATPALLTEDVLVLLLAAAFLGYGLVPERYARERDFVFLFFLLLNAILVAPLLLSRLATRSLDASVDMYSWVALAPETSAVLSLLGVPNTLHAVPGMTAPGLTFTPRNLSASVTVVITTACSGLYTAGIFSSAFVSFVLTEYERPTRRLWAFLGVGLFATYAANILRMVVIVLVGYYTDTAETDLQNLLVAHSYAGWFIFLGWTALFWGVLFRFLPPERKVAESERMPREGREETRRRGVCGICGKALSPALVATRCMCGLYLHQACLLATARCPQCGHVHGTVSARSAGNS